MTFIIVNCDVVWIYTAKYLRLFAFAKQVYLKVCHPRCVVNNYTIVHTVNEHNKYGMVLQMYLTIHKHSIATNVIYSNNNYMFRPRGAIIRLCNRILNRLRICGHF
jgi:hypothetical protein